MRLPISGDNWTDRNQRLYSLPKDSCVGDMGPSPAEVTVISRKSGRKPGAGGYPGAYGSPYAGGRSAGRAGAQGGTVRTIDSGPLGCAGSYYGNGRLVGAQDAEDGDFDSAGDN